MKKTIFISLFVLLVIGQSAFGAFMGPVRGMPAKPAPDPYVARVTVDHMKLRKRKNFLGCPKAPKVIKTIRAHRQRSHCTRINLVFVNDVDYTADEVYKVLRACGSKLGRITGLDECAVVLIRFVQRDGQVGVLRDPIDPELIVADVQRRRGA